MQGAPKQKQALDRITGHDLRVNVCAFYHAGREKILEASASQRQLCGPDCLWASKEVTAVMSEDRRDGRQSDPAGEWQRRQRGLLE